MSVALGERPADLGAGGGGAPARRAVVRWAWRLFRWQPRDPRDINARLGLPNANKHAAVLRPQRKNMTRLDQVAGD